MSRRNLIFDTARRTLAIEAEALARLRDGLDEQFVDVVEAIHAGPGRVVVTGIGKSALVGQKIAATLNSTGTPALFMHAADAIHGDVGMVQEGDWVLCLSKSGETQELRALVPLLRSNGHRIVAVVSKAESYLAKAADFTIVTPISQEADPHDLAPTASTVVQMAVGDALACALLALRGFGPSDFARFHPGGSLGKQLYMRLADLAARNERPAVAPGATLRQVIVEMTTRRLGATAVVDGDRLVGMITDGDLRRMLERGEPTKNLLAKDLMSGSPISMPADSLVVKALPLFRAGTITQLLLTEGEDSYAGMVHLHDLVQEGLF